MRGTLSDESEARSRRSNRSGRCHHRNELELDEVRPAGRPLSEKLRILALHDLEAAPEILRHPARDVSQALGCEAALFAKPSVDGQRIPVAKPLDDHVVHVHSCEEASEKKL